MKTSRLCAAPHSALRLSKHAFKYAQYLASRGEMAPHGSRHGVRQARYLESSRRGQFWSLFPPAAVRSVRLVQLRQRVLRGGKGVEGGHRHVLLPRTWGAEDV